MRSDFRTYDMQIFAKINPSRENFVYSPKENKIEEHTGIILLDFDIEFKNNVFSKNLTAVSFADPFYQGENRYNKDIYDLSSGTTLASNLRRDDDNNVILPARNITAINPETNLPIAVEVTTKTTLYASDLNPDKSKDIDEKSISRFKLDYKDTGESLYLSGLAIQQIDLCEELKKAKIARANNNSKGKYHPWLQKIKSWRDCKILTSKPLSLTKAQLSR
ncbi:MAG: hypothetical protein AB7U85_04350 [Alphaproteobacteria bacterium]